MNSILNAAGLCLLSGWFLADWLLERRNARNTEDHRDAMLDEALRPRVVRRASLYAARPVPVPAHALIRDPRE
jgi:hypothetical protein